MAQNFERVRLVIADSSPMIRSGLRSALYGMGFRNLSDTGSYVRLHDLIAQDSFDLLICNSELEGNQTSYLISEMRNQQLGTNPFPIVISLVSLAEPDYVRSVIDGGCDDLLLTPVSPEQLIVRIEKLARQRKPFVITHDYTGPDRRAKARAFETHSAPMLEVPNPLRLRADTGFDGNRMARQVAESTATLNRLKIERHAVQVDWLVKHIHASIRDGVVNGAQIVPYTSKLVRVAEDMIRRMTGTPAEGHIGKVTDLFDLAKKLDNQLTNIAYSDLERLDSISNTIFRNLSHMGGAHPVSGHAAPNAPLSVHHT